MNAPLPSSERLLLDDISLDDKYSLERGRVFMTGIQALIRLPMLQRQHDLQAGLNTAGYVTGYRGSPLGTVDQTAAKAKKYLDAAHVKFHPGMNEDLAATAVWGTQQVNLFPGAQYDGVFSLWYGKGPGVDRCGDVFKHANMAGTSQHGGVLVIAGDDHAAKSSTTAHQSEHILKACGIPVLYPSSVQEYLDYGLHGWAMSRYTGLWVSLKCVTDIVESGMSVEIDPQRVQPIIPTDFELPLGGLNIRQPDTVLEQETRMNVYKWYAALAYARVNKLNQIIWDSPRARIGIVTAGKSYLDTRQALYDLGIDEQVARDIGIRLYKIGMTWPLEAEGVREFAQGLDEILVVEEKRQILEYQIKEELYNWRDDVRPRVVGKFDDTGEWSGSPREGHGNWLLPATYELSPAQIARAIATRISKYYAGHPIEQRVKARIAFLEAKEATLNVSTKPDPNKDRIPHFCSGCPHNTSTKLPDGSRALAGIGCHYMVTWMDRESTIFSHMGGEGVTWVGQAPFTSEKHVFSNLGDGTYFHSGLLAVRAAVAGKVNMTYKILYNDAVAMTGGQEFDGPLDPAMISRQLAAENVRPIIVVTDEPDKYPAGTPWAEGVTIRHRSELDAVQRELREVQGVSAMIYDQTCASEKRRRRKRDAYPDPAKRAVINEAVCEGCGDCSVQSNCLSVEPLETEFGRKRQINQSSCNKDYSCVNGFCPSFVTVEGGKLKKAKRVAVEKTEAAGQGQVQGPLLPEPQLPAMGDTYGIVVTGIGGTGVITIGQILAMAAHVEGKACSVLDMSGLAQKGGPVMSHVRLSERPDDLYSTRVGTGAADLVIGCDVIVTASRDALSRMGEGRTHAAVNATRMPTAAFVRNPDWQFPAESAEGSIQSACGKDRVALIDAGNIATALMGDAIATNMFMLGYAWQRGWVPLSEGALLKAIELNALSVEFNKQAFGWGRAAAHDADMVAQAARRNGMTAQVIDFKRPPALEEVLAKRIDFLTQYQNAAYARQYSDFVAQAQHAEAALGEAGKAMKLSTAVATYLFKLMAYKDEYEVARLYTAPAFREKIAGMFEGDYQLKFHLAPPLLAKHDNNGHLIKKEYGSWMMRAFGVLAKLRFLRNTPLDVFGYTAERKQERALIGEYCKTVGGLLSKLNADNLAQATAIARIPEDIRGYGHVKERHLKAAKQKETDLLRMFDAGQKPHVPAGGKQAA
ncbi:MULTISPECIES: indolepyruvate ferredoxin oxidoreductase family protein [unclassified Herbaspirillum]|uniref:indolepyruvate ferredoxin oxidoreductase family protein n=1 Tax=unclassified Herbaspirillum TaxID=2624150 RepID=UPI000E2E55B9|nr:MULTISPECIES: indolepyruvate ferredoxin oxidoreductase family protein [unclassified Herbaspirillum]RFB71023.1 indolepyruvate ferredoxin oxidoreductase family protein [Herbaspirillum sp. 3R-3a1]TFI08456.1 indolepyruvate ferredoxin oxidoreductase family protein [Herbaspirillum sp. 3R11]TFI14871.1 indolepyruvate ferredoxin oxidoreductase family protein [Herbaspirillum sp. 3R-11]TFI30338.1 indolepyruvate ferredoxin oxidoreductase family protein [Herbaspirillum sp. 3C11]